ncbi:DUF3616 domain-containing protein [Paraburkholderia hospita]|uniref:DUF3616 domain-containing protein n=1 Tax=Paraburkholderia hospita TaxID=169430 RepID=UPI000B341B7A|nr:DUF3616 domain-containing protein [Paraburkholderia hospita]OUL96279.1 hypothetical protein CA601_03020 [Paraburkholderia hospita]
MAPHINGSQPIGHVRLHFRDEGSSKIPTSLSAVEQINGSLWLGADESASLERLSTHDRVNFDSHESFPLVDFFALPGGPDQEVDLEGLAWDDEASQLWLVGSHSLRRQQPKDGESGKGALKAMSVVDRQANRYLLGAIKLDHAQGEDGKQVPQPVPESATAMQFTAASSQLIELLTGNALLSPFLAIPSKDNGFDIEGLAVKGNSVFLGLRGPVLRGWATVLQLRPEQDGPLLKPGIIAGDDRKYLHHLLDLGGLGIRDLCVVDNDLLVLAGPTMALDGPIRVFRWRDAFRNLQERRIDASALDLLFDIPWGERVDHAEGISLFKTADGDTRLLVVYDSPAKKRLHDGMYFEADLFSIRS